MKESQAGLVNVNIYDRDFSLRTSGDTGRLQMLSAHLDGRMREAAQGAGTVDTLKVAILAALSLADDLFRTREELRNMDEVIGRRSLECVVMLDRFLH